MNRIELFQTARRATVLLAVIVSVGGCATKRDVRDLGIQMQDLAARSDAMLAALERQGMATQDTLRTTTQELNDIRGDVARQLNIIAESLDRLTEMVGGNSRAISSIRDQLETLRRSGVATAPRQGEIPATGPGGDIIGGRTNRGPAADEAYRLAIGFFNSGSLTTARAAFEDFLTQYPQDELAPQAHLKLGDIDVQEENLDAAFQRFARVPEEFPTDRAVPLAIYRMGTIRVEQDQLAEARRLFQRIINSYPDAPEAVDAQDRLDEIGGGDTAQVSLLP